MKGALVGYNEFTKACKVYISSQPNIIVSQDMKFDENAWSSRSQEPPEEVEEGETLAVPNVDPEKLFHNQISKVLNVKSML